MSNEVYLLFVAVGTLIQIAGCIYQYWTRKKIEALVREMEHLALVFTERPVTGEPNGKVSPHTFEESRS